MNLLKKTDVKRGIFFRLSSYTLYILGKYCRDERNSGIKENIVMILYKQDYLEPLTLDVELAPPDLRRDMEKTRQALDTAYAGFNNATDFDMIDSYIFEINALQQRYRHLSQLAEREGFSPAEKSGKHTPIRSWIARIFS